MLEALDLAAENAREGVTAFRAISPIAKEGTAWLPGPGLKQTCKKRVCSLRGPNNLFPIVVLVHSHTKQSKQKQTQYYFFYFFRYILKYNLLGLYVAHTNAFWADHLVLDSQLLCSFLEKAVPPSFSIP